MDRLFDRLGELLHSLLGAGGPAGAARERYDPDLQAAYEELEAYLRDGPRPERGPERPGGRSGGDAGRGPGGRPGGERGGSTGGVRPAPAEELRTDFDALQVPFGAGLHQVRSSYKSLILKYHPDRFSRDPDKQRLATEVSQRLNEAYRRILAHYGGRGAGNRAEV